MGGGAAGNSGSDFRPWGEASEVVNASDNYLEEKRPLGAPSLHREEYRSDAVLASSPGAGRRMNS